MKLKITLLAMLATTAISAQTSFEKAMDCIRKPCKDYVLVVAHRGVWQYAPENSLPAVQRAIDLGVDIVEIDVRKTKDGKMILMHDLTVDRTTNGKGKVSEFTLAEIKNLRLKTPIGGPSKVRVPTLEEVMNLAKGKIIINLDKTEGEMLKEAYEVLKKTATVDQTIFKGNDTYAFMKKKYGKLMKKIYYMPKLWYKKDDNQKRYKDWEDGINPSMYEILYDNTNAETYKMLEEVQNQGNVYLAIALWDELCAGHTDDNVLFTGADANWGWLLKQGAGGIMTDRTEELIAYLKKKGLR